MEFVVPANRTGSTRCHFAKRPHRPVPRVNREIFRKFWVLVNINSSLEKNWPTRGSAKRNYSLHVVLAKRLVTHVETCCSGIASVETSKTFAGFRRK